MPFLPKLSLLLIIFFLLPLSIIYGQSQLSISGTVLSKENKEPMTGASIYFNGTTIGAFVDANGQFELPYDSLFSEIVVSYLGYKTLTYNIRPDEWSKKFNFLLEEDYEQLETVNITATRTKAWQRNLNQFLTYFIGYSYFAKRTKILNPEALYFEIDEATNTLNAYARVPLQIENKALGYRIAYDLQQFQLQRFTGRMSLLGFTRFIKIEGSKSKNKRWAKNQNESYIGSFTHFIHTLQNDALEDSDFEIRKLKIIPNPDRPSNEKINSAYKALRKINSMNTGNYSIAYVDSLQSLADKRNLPKSINILAPNPHDPTPNIIQSGETTILDFENHWQVSFTGERLSKLIAAGAYSKNRTQISTITLLTPTALIDKYGLLQEPLSILFAGFWTYEKIPYLLPLDYIKTRASTFSH